MVLKFYICETCGNIVTHLRDSGVPIVCCGDEMQELVAGLNDGAAEKHVPVITVAGNVVTVKIGEVAHPMLEEHYIQWIVLETKEGTQTKHLEAGMKPEAVFALSAGDEVIAAYEFCNIHSLWKK